MKPVISYLTIFGLGIATTAIAEERVIRVEPGLWEYTHSLQIPGLLAPMAKPKTECITTKQAQRNLSDLLTELAAGGTCSFDNLKSDLGTVKFDLTCAPKIGETEIHANGSAVFKYGRTKITGSAIGTVSMGEQNLKVEASAEAKRIGRC